MCKKIIGMIFLHLKKCLVLLFLLHFDLIFLKKSARKRDTLCDTISKHYKPRH